MGGGEFSADPLGGVLSPASAVRPPEQRPSATETETKARRRPAPRKDEAEDSLPAPDDNPEHQLDDLA
jgi:hypothetical protein